MAECKKHQWIVYSTSLVPPTIMVYCEKCEAEGYVENYTQQEWNDAFHAPSSPYRWTGKGKVTITNKGKIKSKKPQSKLKLVEYVQQPCSIYAFITLLASTKAEGLLKFKDLIEWLAAEGADAKLAELKKRWRELEQLGFAKPASGMKANGKWKIRAGWVLPLVLTEKGDKAMEALMDTLNYIKSL